MKRPLKPNFSGSVLGLITFKESDTHFRHFLRQQPAEFITDGAVAIKRAFAEAANYKPRWLEFYLASAESDQIRSSFVELYSKASEMKEIKLNDELMSCSRSGYPIVRFEGAENFKCFANARYVKMLKTMFPYAQWRSDGKYILIEDMGTAVALLMVVVHDSYQVPGFTS